MTNVTIRIGPPLWFDDRDSVLIYQCGERRVWKVRNELILKRTLWLGANSEAATHRFVAENTGVPVPEVLDEWLSPDGRHHFLLERRVRGRALADCWARLSAADRRAVAEQVVGHMDSLSRFAGARMASLSGMPLPNNCFNPRPLDVVGRGFLSGRWRTDDEVFDNEFLPSLRRARVSPTLIRLLRRTMPPCEAQLRLTHGDLYLGNIMVAGGSDAHDHDHDHHHHDDHDDDQGYGDSSSSSSSSPASMMCGPVRVTAIIDWESAGFWPGWFQHARITHGCTRDDGEWKALLGALQQDHVPHADHGRVWYDAVQRLLYRPESARAQRWLLLLVRYLDGRAGKGELRRYRERRSFRQQIND